MPKPKANRLLTPLVLGAKSRISVDQLRIPKADPRDRIQAEPFSVKLPVWIKERVEAVAEANGFSRNKAFRECLRSYFAAVDAQSAKDEAADPSRKPR